MKKIKDFIDWIVMDLNIILEFDLETKANVVNPKEDIQCVYHVTFY